MNSLWQKLPLKDLLIKSDDWVVLKTDESYREITVRLWGKGVVLRGEVTGMEVASKQRNKVRAGQLILSKIDARHGAFGIIPPKLDGAIVSGDFPVFDVNTAQVDARFLEWMTKGKEFVEICKKASEGTTNRVRLKEDKFLEMIVAIPPLPEQRKIVTSIASIEDKFRKVMQTRELRDKLIGSCYDSVSNKIFSSSQMGKYSVTLGKAVEDEVLFINTKTRNPQTEGMSEEFLYVDISSVERGPGVINIANRIKSVNAPSRARRVIRKNDVVFSTVRPNLRAIAKIGEDLDDQICSTGFTVFTCGVNILPDFLLYQLSSGYFIDQCITRGGHYPAINDANLRKTSLIIPPVDVQEKVITALAAITTLQKKISVENEVIEKKLNALMPSVLDKAFKGEL